MSLAKPNCNDTTRDGMVLAIVAKNAGANLVRLGLSWLVVLFLPPLLVRVLDKPAYGTWVLILQIGAYVSLFDNGIQSAISRFVARGEELQDQVYLRQAVSSAGSILVGGGILTLIATLLCCWQLEHLFPGVPVSLLTGARVALLVIGVSLAVSLPFSTLAGMFLGLQMNQVNAAAGGAGKLLGAVGAGWAAWRHEGLAAMAIWVAVGNLLQSAILYLWSLRAGLHDLVDTAHVTGAAIREFARFCYAMFATQLGSLLITGLDMPVVAAFDFSAAAYYAIASTASNMLAVPQGAIVTSLIPVASGMSATGNPERLGAVVLRTTRYATAILCLLILPLLCALHPLLRVWVGADYAVHAERFAALLIVAQFVRLTLMPYAVIGFGAGQQDRMLASPIAEGIVNLGCSVVGAWLWGAIGVALGTLIGAIVGVFCHFGISMPKTGNMRFSRWMLLRGGLARPIAITIPAFLAAFWLARASAPEPVQLAFVPVAEIITAFILWRMNFTLAEREQMMVLAGRVFGHARTTTGA
jgi:O-antigen/teichoic acid export membrane protein